MPKISQLPQDAETVISPTDYVPAVQAGIPGTVRFLLSQLAGFFWTLSNIPAGATSPVTRDNYTIYPFVQSGMVWSGDAYGSTLLASMTTGIVFLNGRFITVAAVSHRAFTASVDTYIDVLDNGDGTGTLVYTTVTNNNASPALAANSIRIGIIVAGATNIAAAGSVNQGQESAVLPIASSIAYAVTDSLGNLICCRDPANKIIGYRQINSNFSSSSASQTQVTGLSAPCFIPTGRKVRVTFGGTSLSSTAGSLTLNPTIWDGTVGSGTQIVGEAEYEAAATGAVPMHLTRVYTPGATSKTYNAGISTPSSTITVNASANSPAYIMVELE